MVTKDIEAALPRAVYEIIQDEEPFYAEVPGLQGVWASGNTLEECRRNLAETVEDWVLLSVAKGLPVPPPGEAALPRTTHYMPQTHLPPRIQR